MKAYILSIAGVVLITAVISMIVPQGKTGKFIKGIGKLLILSVMVSPFVLLFTKNKDFSLESGMIETDNAYLVHCAEILSERDEAEIKAYLREEFSVESQTSVKRGTGAGFPREKIEVKITDFGIIGQDEHIYMIGQIQSALQTKYNCEAEVL